MADGELCKHPLVQHEPVLPHTLHPAEGGLLPDSFQRGNMGGGFLSYIKPEFNYVCARPLDLVFFIGFYSERRWTFPSSSRWLVTVGGHFCHAHMVKQVRSGFVTPKASFDTFGCAIEVSNGMTSLLNNVMDGFKIKEIKEVGVVIRNSF